MIRWAFHSDSPEATQALGERLAQLLEEGMVVALSGELGAGKTCFARGVVRGLGVPPQIPVTSPTFALMNRYEGRLTLYHFDLYRLDDPEALLELGLDEFMGNDGVALVEWAEKGRLTVPALWLTFSGCGETGRGILVEAGAERYRPVVAGLAGATPDRSSNPPSSKGKMV